MSSVLDDEKKMTPMMEQWHRCKLRAKEAILLFRMGDFYEAFYEDAALLAKELELTLTKRQGIPMSGVPWHTGDSYIDRLVAKGYRVAIAEQTEDPKQAKGLVHREIVRYVTPGTLINSTLLGDKSHNFIGALTQVGSIFGLATCDITTATFRVVEIEEREQLLNEIFRLNLSELVICKKFREKQGDLMGELKQIPLFTLDEWNFDHKAASHYLTNHLKVSHLDGFGLKAMVAAINAAGALLAYMGEELSLSMAHIKEIKPYCIKEGLLLDKTCQLNLELTESPHKSLSSTLLQVIDQTLTPMGGRLLIEWLKKPLLNVEEIVKRQESIETLLFSGAIFCELPSLLKDVRDLERLVIKISSGYAHPRDVSLFASSLKQIGPIKKILKGIEAPLLMQCCEQLIELPDLVAEISSALVDEPPIRISEGNIFRPVLTQRLMNCALSCRGGGSGLPTIKPDSKKRVGLRILK